MARLLGCVLLAAFAALCAATTKDFLTSPGRELRQNADCGESCKVCSTSGCQECFSSLGVFLENNLCTRCSSKIKNCFKCTSGDKCDSCLPGFEGPQCTKIEGCDPNCTRCRNKELCDNNGCKTGYYTFRNGAGQCLSCSTQDIPDCERCFWFLAKNQRGPGELRCSNARGVICEQTRGVDYPGNDIINTPFNINNHPDCCAKCQGTKGCKGWLFRGDFGHCWLKSKLVNPEPCSDCIAMKI